MKKFLLPENGNFYKANLHCHTCLSDGRFTPEEIKAEYKAHGYSIVAYTDHHCMFDHSYLNDEGFLALMGCELDLSENRDVPHQERKVVHFNCISLKPKNTHLFFFGSMLDVDSKNAERFPKETEFYRNMERCKLGYVPANISYMFEKLRAADYFVTYNHPGWSREEYPQYINYNGMNALEIFNYDSYLGGHEAYVPTIYDDMLRAGKRIYCVAGDDTHGKAALCGSFTMIKAAKLDYETVAKAMVDGHFYASNGPEIKSLVFEDGKIKIECSEAERIAINAHRRRARSVFAKDGACVTYAEFDVFPEDTYVRLTVTDARGKNANTNAYFTDELFSE